MFYNKDLTFIDKMKKCKTEIKTVQKLKIVKCFLKQKRLQRFMPRGYYICNIILVMFILFLNFKASVFFEPYTLNFE